MPQQAHVTDGVVDAVGIPSVREKLKQKPDGFNPSNNWFYTTPPSEKKPHGVYDITDLPYEPVPLMHFAYGEPSYDPARDIVFRQAARNDFDIDEAKKRLYTNLAAKRYEVEIVGTTLLNGLRVGTDERTRSALNLAMIQIANGRTKSVNWKIEVNGVTGFQSLDVPMIQQIYTALTSHIEASFDREKQLSDQIERATTVAALREIDIDAGWPS